MILKTQPDYTLSQFMAYIEQDFSLFANNGFIKESIIIPNILLCNEDLGYRLHQSKQCRVKVENNRAFYPEDVWKFEFIVGFKTVNHSENVGSIYGLQSWHIGDLNLVYPSEQEKFEKIGIIPVGEFSGEEKATLISKYKPEVSKEVESKIAIPLKFSGKANSKCASYINCNVQIDNFVDIDVESGELIFPFKTGEALITYLGDRVNSEGELLITRHPKLFPFYEWTVKAKICEHILFNSDADIIRKYQLAESKRTAAKETAFNFLFSATERQLDEHQAKMKTEYYMKWYKMFEY